MERNEEICQKYKPLLIDFEAVKLYFKSLGSKKTILELFESCNILTEMLDQQLDDAMAA